MTTIHNNTSGIAGGTTILDQDAEFALLSEMAAEAEAERAQLLAIHPDSEGQLLHRFHECGCTFGADGSVIVPDAEFALLSEMAAEAEAERAQLLAIHPDSEGQLLHRFHECGCTFGADGSVIVEESDEHSDKK